MKRVIVVPDGMADEPLDELGGATPLEAARTPHLDALAREGLVGLVRTVPEGMAAGSDVANLGVLGYDPRAVYTGRAPLEAASIGVGLGRGDVAYRCNLVTIADGVMDDFTAGHVAGDRAARLVALLNERVAAAFADDGAVDFHAGVSYRNLLVWRGGRDDVATTPPHDIIGRAVGEHLPSGAGAGPLRGLMARAHDVLADGAANPTKVTDIWLWGQGRTPSLPLFRDVWGVSGAAVAAADLIKGISVLAGLEAPDVPGATAFLDTDYASKARVALDALARVDFVYVHVEAPDEAGHMGDIEEKVKAIEAVDREIVGRLAASPLVDALLVLPDHPTPVRVRTHVADPVPFVLWRRGSERGRSPGADVGGSAAAFGEREAAASGLRLESGRELMTLFLESEPAAT